MGAPIGAGFDNKVLKRRRALIHEEYSEVFRAFHEMHRQNVRLRRLPGIYTPMGGPDYTERQLAPHDKAQRALAQELVDLIYVTVGTFVELGIDPQPVWAAVHAANMQKEPSPDGGKAVKPAGWQKPRIVLRSFEGVIPLIVGSSRSLAATSLRRLNVPGAAQHARTLAVATTPQSERSTVEHCGRPFHPTTCKLDAGGSCETLRQRYGEARGDG